MILESPINEEELYYEEQENQQPLVEIDEERRKNL